uniref:hypothetical protein n=1 Tax=Alkalilacustris brevis TaxID=2026338 RepID=UPI001EE4B6D5
MAHLPKITCREGLSDKQLAVRSSVVSESRNAVNVPHQVLLDSAEIAAPTRKPGTCLLHDFNIPLRLWEQATLVRRRMIWDSRRDFGLEGSGS